MKVDLAGTRELSGLNNLKGGHWSMGHAALRPQEEVRAKKCGERESFSDFLGEKVVVRSF